MILALLGCSVDRPSGTATVADVATTLGACVAYTEQPDVYGVCLTRYAASLETPGQLDQVCPQAGRWEGECRHAWVIERQRRNLKPARAELLAACGASPDCAFQVLDTQPEGSLADQLRLCETHVQPYVSDCVGHALRRWVDERRPDLPEARRVIAAEPAHEEAIGEAIGRAAQCDQALVCPEEAGVAWDACRTARVELADPRKCGAAPPPPAPRAEVARPPG